MEMPPPLTNGSSNHSDRENEADNDEDSQGGEREDSQRSLAAQSQHEDADDKDSVPEIEIVETDQMEEIHLMNGFDKSTKERLLMK